MPLPYSATEGTFVLNGTYGVKLTKAITREYKTMVLEIVPTDNNPFAISASIRKSNNVLADYLVASNGFGEIYSPIQKAGIYYYDIKGASSIVLSQIKSGTSANGTVTYRLLTEELADSLRPIQEIYTLENTFDGGESYVYMTISTQVHTLQCFKFIRAEIEYTGTNSPSANILMAPYYGSEQSGAFKEILAISTKKDSTDWLQNIGAAIRFRIDFPGFTPTSGDKLSIKLYGMR